MNLNIENSKKLLSDTFKEHTQNISIWGGFFTASLIVFFLLSSGDFSFLLTYASFMRCFGFGVLIFKMWHGRSARGLSLKTLELYCIVFLARLLSIMRHQGYLPFDKTGDWFYHAVEFLSFAAVTLAVVCMFTTLSSTYEKKYDLFGNLHIPDDFGIIYLLVPCVVLAIIFHPSLNHEYVSDICWTISMYLESVAMLPQLFMFHKEAVDGGNVVEALTGHMVFALGFSRVFELVFWIASFRELADHAGSRTSGWLVLLAQLAHVGIMGDFFYYYLKSLSQGKPMELPTTYSAHV